MKKFVFGALFVFVLGCGITLWSLNPNSAEAVTPMTPAERAAAVTEALSVLYIDCTNPDKSGRTWAANYCDVGGDRCALCDSGGECNDALDYLHTYCYDHAPGGPCAAGGLCCGWDLQDQQECYSGGHSYLTSGGSSGCSCFTP